MPVITVGRLHAEDIRMNADGESRWVKGVVKLHPACFPLLSEIGQRKLPFVLSAGRIIPKEYAVLLGEIQTYPIPNTNIIWKTLEIRKIITKKSSIWKELDLDFSDAIRLIAKGDPKLLEQLGSTELIIRKRITDLVGTKNRFADAMIQQFGEDAYQALKKNPWRMIHLIPYFTIQQADKVAQKVGLSLDDPKRFREYFRYLLDQSFKSHRNTFMTENEFMAFYWMHFSDQMSVEDYRKLSVTEGSPIRKTSLGYHPEHFYEAERAAYDVVCRSLPIRIQPDMGEQAITEQVIQKSHLTLTEEQTHAVFHAFQSPLHIITGGPGTGKTTVLSTILQRLIRLTGVSPDTERAPFLLVAPTGKAAFRMWEQTGVPAHTLNSAFRIKPGYGCLDIEEAARQMSHLRYIIIDEASMLDTMLFGELCRILLAMDHLPFLLLVGDADQLPPVQHGQVFIDLLQYLSGHAPDQVTRLTLLQRQDEGSHIPELAALIRNGQFPDLEWFKDKPDLVFLPSTMDTFPEQLTRQVLAPVGMPLETIQILTPYRNGATPDTIHAINAMAEPLYNPADSDDSTRPSITYGNPPQTFHVGDKVINRDNYSDQIINGSLGYVTAIHTDASDIFEWSLEADFDGNTREYTYEELKVLELAYAITIHASQGSEYQNVVVCLLRGSGNVEFLTRNLLYVAVTRASERLVLMGSLSMFQQAAKTPQKSRKTAMAYWLSAKDT